MPPLRKAAGVRTTFQPSAASFAAAVALALPVIHISPLRPAPEASPSSGRLQ